MMRKFLVGILVVVVMSCGSSKVETVDQVRFMDGPDFARSAEPFLFSTNETLLLSWIQERNDSSFVTNYSSMEEGSWTQAREIAKGSNWFVNWADFPAIAMNGSGSLISHFLVKSASSTYAYDVQYKMGTMTSGFEGPSLLLNKDFTPTEHGFVTVLPMSDSTFFITWLDGRNTTETSANKAMNIRAAEITNEGTILNESLLDERTCDCCQTGAAITANGPIVVYRDRTKNEIRDISIVRQVNGMWTQPKPVFKDNWEINGCPVNGPKAAATGSNLAVAWFTAADEVQKVKIAFSPDNGATFGKPIQINENITSGRVGLVLLANGNALVSWIEMDQNVAVTKVRQVSPQGKMFDPITLAAVSNSRSSGFPQIALLKDKMYFAITDVTKDKSTIKTGYINLADLDN